jgi:hypothetical protein
MDIHVKGYHASESRAIQMLNKLERMGFDLVDAQAERPVALGQYGTAVDLAITKPGTESWVLIELKTGMKSAFNGHRNRHDMLAAPLEQYESTPLNHALLQLAATSVMWTATYGTPAAELYVLLAHDESTDLYTFSTTEKRRHFIAAVEGWLRHE